MVHENDDCAMEPLLSSGRVKLLSSPTNIAYDRNTEEHIKSDDIHETKRHPLRESYLSQLGYTPLIFKVKREHIDVECKMI